MDYNQHSQIQAGASGHLFQLLNIQEHEDVLDIGCGNGDLTYLVREKTEGKIVAIDTSESMIEEARKRHGQKNIEFAVFPAESLNFVNAFDVIFSNSAFQWFKNPAQFLQRCYRALKKGGRMGIQNPATNNHCPTFLQAIEEVKNDPRTSATFAHHSSPWFFLEAAEEYRTLFEKAGFHVPHAEIKTVRTPFSPKKVFQLFEAAPAIGYLSPSYYDIPLSEDYIQTFREIVKSSFQKQANPEGMLELVFHRIYVLAEKPA